MEKGKDQLVTDSNAIYNARFCQVVEALLKTNRVRVKNDIVQDLELYSGRLSQILGGRGNVSPDNLSKLCTIYGVSPKWLLLGEGDMFVSASDADSLSDEVRSKCALPLLPIAALAGFNGVDEPGVSLRDCDFYLVPDLLEAGADFLIRIQGSSMSPTYISGDLVACRKVAKNEWLEFGDAYVIDGQQGVMIKRIFNSPDDPDLLLCKSDNPDVAPFSIRKSEVRSLCKVIGLVRKS